MSSHPNRSPQQGDASASNILFKLLIYVLILSAILFFSAGRWNWWQGWLYMAMYAAVTIVAVRVVPLDPELIEERTQLKEGVKEWDKRITSVGSFLYPLAIFVVAGLDERFQWSSDFSLGILLAALGIAALGNLLSIWATKVNRFYGRFVRIQVERGHYAISDGPYSFIRHPGYLGQIIFSLASSLALGSLWALIPAGLFAVLLVVRTGLEDQTLKEELQGYQAYAAKVRYRLVPPLW